MQRPPAKLPIICRLALVASVRFPRIATLLLVLSTLVPGCFGGSRCEATLVASGAQAFCLTPGGGWILQGLEWPGNSAEAPRVWLVHGLNEDHQSYDLFAKDLTGQGWAVVALDSRGHGQSIHRTDGTERRVTGFSPSDYLSMEDDLEALRRRSGHDPTFLVGASIGANQAIRFAGRHGETLGVVLLSPGLDYHGITTQTANREFAGAALYAATNGDPYPSMSARTLYREHEGTRTLFDWLGDEHGTALLDKAHRPLIVDWMLDRLG